MEGYASLPFLTWVFVLQGANPNRPGIIPTTLGNMLGGFFFCGFFYFYMHLLGEDPVAVDGVYYQQPERSLEEGNLFAVRSGTIVEDRGGKSSNSSGEFQRTVQTPTTAAINKVQ